MTKEAKQVPYGIADFETIITQGFYYVDKTQFIPLLESQPRNLFFTRPRRFGKSLLLSMLRCYYDCRKKDDFNRLFGDLWIGQHPTDNQGRYQILYLDFSQVGGDMAHIEERFDSYCGKRIDTFVDRYSAHYPQDVAAAVKASKGCADKLDLLCNYAQEHDLPLYLIIDEYDNFTNTILNEQGEAVYHAIMHANGFYRDMFKKFKGNFERIFMMGVSPVTLDDVTSGFNVGWNISIKPEFNELLGFSTEDVREMFHYFKQTGDLSAQCDVEAMIADMKPWYNNYCFAEESFDGDGHVFNSDMVLYYLRNFMSQGCAPRQMIDPNTKTDYAKMKKLLQFDQLDGDRKGVIRKIAEEGRIVATLLESFPATSLADPEIFPSLLFYYGMLTIQGTLGNLTVLGIPNNNVRKQYYGYLLEQYQEIHRSNLNDILLKFAYMALEGRWREALEAMAEEYAQVSSVRDSIEGERNLQGFFMAYFNLMDYYYTAPELELNHGYCDFFLLPDLTHYDTKHSYIVELKVLHKGYTQEQAERQWSDAVSQIKRYAQAPRVEALRQGTRLHLIIMQFEGHQLHRMEEVN